MNRILKYTAAAALAGALAAATSMPSQAGVRDVLGQPGRAAPVPWNTGGTAGLIAAAQAVEHNENLAIRHFKNVGPRTGLQ
jgi:hypothetical protein